MAPEILRYERYDAKSDLWSVGAVLYEMCCGRAPFRAQNHVELLRKIEKGEDRIKFPAAVNDIQAELAPDIRNLICALLKRQAVERLSFEEFFASPVFHGWAPPVYNSARTAFSPSSSDYLRSQSSSITASQLASAPQPTRPAPAIPESLSTKTAPARPPFAIPAARTDAATASKVHAHASAKHPITSESPVTFGHSRPMAISAPKTNRPPFAHYASAPARAEGFLRNYPISESPVKKQFPTDNNGSDYVMIDRDNIDMNMLADSMYELRGHVVVLKDSRSRQSCEIAGLGRNSPIPGYRCIREA